MNNSCTPRILLACAVATGLAGTAIAQTAHDWDKDLTINVPTDPTTVSVDWTRKVRAVARVGRLCRDASGFNLTPKVVGVASGVNLVRNEFADAGRNSLCTATADAVARWDELSPTSFYLATRSFGSANPASDECIGNKVRPARARSRASSRVTLFLDGDREDALGSKSFSAEWVNDSNERQGFKQNGKNLKDPVVVSAYDAGGGLLGQWETIRIDSAVFGDGQTSVAPATDFPGFLRIDNDADDMNLHVVIGSNVVNSTDVGELHIIVEDGVVTKRTITGRFAAASTVPPSPNTTIPTLTAVGTQWTAFIDMSNIDYDLRPFLPPGPVQLVFDMGGASHTSSHGGLVAPVCSVVSRLEDGFDTADLSVAPVGDSVLGYSCMSGDASVLENFTPDADVEPDFAVVPYYIEGAAPGTAPSAVYVQLYEGNPSTGGIWIYGSGAVSQSFETEDIQAYRVLGTDLLNSTRAIGEAIVDLSGAPTLAAGVEYWIEVWMDHPTAGMIAVPPSPYGNNLLDDGLTYSFVTGEFTTLADPVSGKKACLPIEVHGLPPGACASDYNDDYTLDIMDFLNFFDDFGACDFDPSSCNAMGDLDFTADGVIDILDVLGFLDQFTSGC